MPAGSPAKGAGLQATAASRGLDGAGIFAGIRFENPTPAAGRARIINNLLTPP